jgi:lipopolysaccharide transport system ATP-binding protein
MSDAIISVSNLGKCYHIAHQANRPRYTALRDVVAEKLKSLFPRGKPEAGSRDSIEHFWALKDVSFEVKRGEVVGIIGRNGAGKSTLLKILSRITEPTEGEALLRGRVASLLEVGTGFHPELTGRENILLNGAILGMSRVEIRTKFDEIVAFAEIEKFLDTPVKRYSSGMYVRLAFAVAAHLEPEILIVDEVLAVGDAEFQKKCLGKMQDVASGGRTVLFVSHNMAAISKLCQKCILLNAGEVKRVGPTEEIIPHYLTNNGQAEGIRTWADTPKKNQDPRFKIRALRIMGPDGINTGHVDGGKPITIEVEYQILERLSQFRVGLRVFTSDGTLVFATADSVHPNFDPKPRAAGIYRTLCIIPENLLNETSYSLTIGADIPFVKILFMEEAALSFSVQQTSELYSRFPEKWPGVICPHFEWQTRTIDSGAL